MQQTGGDETVPGSQAGSQGRSDVIEQFKPPHNMFASDPVSRLDSGFDSASADLTAWSFLEDLDAGFDPVVDDLALQQPAGPKSTNQEKSKEKNRIAQKRFRQRKKVCHFQRCRALPGPFQCRQLILARAGAI